MELRNGNFVVSTIPGKRVIKSATVGKGTVEQIKWLTKQLVSQSVPYKATGWAYLVDISKMDPVTPEVSAELVEMTKAIVAAGCKVTAFVEGGSYMTAAQVKQHQKSANATVQEGHFSTEAEAMKFIDGILK